MGRMWHSLLFSLFVIYSPTLGCKTGWIQFLDKCYHFSTLARDWGVASSYCEAFGSKLAEPHSEVEAHFLSSHAQKFGRKSFWIGITDMLEESKWIYASNQEPIHIASLWGPREPSGHTAENCAMLWSGSHDQMSDYGCSGALNFICEQSQDVITQIVG